MGIAFLPGRKLGQYHLDLQVDIIFATGSFRVPQAALLLPRFTLQSAKRFHPCERVTRQGEAVALLDYLSVEQCTVVQEDIGQGSLLLSVVLVGRSRHWPAVAQ